MPGSRLYNFTLKQPQFEVTPFQAVAFEPKEQPNFGLLANAFEKIEQRENTSIKAKADINALFSTIDSKLNKEDKETMDWWNKFQQQRLDAINDFVRGGDYSKAFQFATEAAGEAANNKELLARQYRYETYKTETDKQKARADSGDIRESTYAYYKDTNPFDYDFIKDDDGNIISSKAWKGKAPVKDFDFIKHYATAFQLINPDTKSKGSSSQVTKSNNVHGLGTSTTRGGGYSTSRTSISVNEVLGMIDDVFLLNHDNIESLRQRYLVDKHMLEKQIKEFNSMSDADKNSDRGKDLEFEIELKKKLLWYNNGFCGERVYYARLIAGMYNAGVSPTDTIDESDFVRKIAGGLKYTKESHESNSNRSDAYTDNRGDGNGSTTGNGNQSRGGLIGWLDDMINGDRNNDVSRGPNTGQRRGTNNGSGGARPNSRFNRRYHR